MEIKTQTIAQKIENYPLLEAYFNGNITKFKKLVNEGENINCHDDKGQSLISIIIRNKRRFLNNRDFFDTLISKGVYLGYNNTTKGLLSIAVESQDGVYYAKELLKNKVNVNSFGKCVQFCNDWPYVNSAVPFGPPIFEAINYRKNEFIDLFIEYNFDINMCNHNNRTVLEFFLSSSFVWQKKPIEVFKRLIEHGADLDSLDVRGANILGTIIRNKQYHLLEYLFEKSTNININHQNKSGITPVMEAVINGDIDTVKFLIEKGVNLDLYEKDGGNALIFSIHRNTMDIFQLLTESGANILSTNKKSEKNNIMHKMINIECNDFPKGYDATWFYPFYEIILKKHPQILRMKNNNGETPIDIFKKNNRYTQEKKRFFDKFNDKENLCENMSR